VGNVAARFQISANGGKTCSKALYACYSELGIDITYQNKYQIVVKMCNRFYSRRKKIRSKH